MPLLEKAWKGFLWGTTGKISEAFLGLLYTLVISRLLGPADYGMYALFMSWLVVIVAVTSLGFNESLGKFVPPLIEKGRWPSVTALFRRFLACRVLVIAGIAAAAFAAKDALFPLIAHCAPWLFFLSVARGANELYNYFFTALLEIRTNTAIKFIAQLLSLALVILFFRLFEPSVTSVLIALTASSAVALLLYTLTLLRRGAARPVEEAASSGDPGPRGEILKFSAVIWITGLVTFGLGNHIDQIFISYFLKDKAAIGFYNIAALIPTTAYALLITGWGITTLPVLSTAYEKYRESGLARSWNGYFKVMLILIIPVSVFVLGYAEEIVILAFGADYAPAGPLMQLYLGLAAVAYLFAPGLSTFSLYTLLRQGSVMKIRMAAGALNIILDIVLIPAHGVPGALFATGFSLSVAFFLEFAALRKHLVFEYPLATLLKTSLAAAAALIVSRLVPGGGLPFLASAGLLFATVLFLGLYLLKPLSQTEYEIVRRLNAGLAKTVKGFCAQP